MGDGGATYKPTANVTLYAKWTAKTPITPGVSITGWTYGEAANTPSVTGNPGNGAVTYAYKVKSADDGAYSATVPTDAGEYTVRATVAETDNYASGTATANFTISPKRVTIPTAVTGLKYTGGEQTGVVEGTGYTVANGKATAVGSYAATATLTSTTNYKWSDDTTEAKEISWRIDKADGPAAPNNLAGVAPTTANGSDGKITGVNATMEYSTASNFSSKTACTGSEITGLAAGTYYVRVAETDTHNAGAAATVNVPAYAAASVGGDISDGTFVAKAVAPKGGLLIAAVYDGSGRQVSVKTYTLTASSAQQVKDTEIAVTKGYTYKVMLVNASTYVPLCKAWSEKKA